MQTTYLNEHDANQGAQSSGEFLGMSGNSGWYLLGAAGASILIVVLLWGMFGVPFLLCLLAGVVLCGISVAYVFGLKNNRPAHYDTDYFESALVEAGVRQFNFGPRARRPANPFVSAGAVGGPATTSEPRRVHQATPSKSRFRRNELIGVVRAPEVLSDDEERRETRAAATLMVPRVAFERLEEKLAATEEMLEESLAERVED